MKELTARQKEVLSFISGFINRRSFPPSIREIGEYFGMSVKGAHDHVTALKRKGYLKQDDRRARTMELVSDRCEDGPVWIEVPLLGSVAAGVPILSEENWDGNIIMHRSMLKKNKKYFAMKVRGDSMNGAGIIDGDTAIIEKTSSVHNGEIALVVVDDGITLKRFYRESTRIRLQPENPAHKVKYYQDVRLEGRLARILRYY
ncbi:MAG: transcriptional repressor LexA [Treponema sp.]|jgi:repressor LexA|nr:transcriptional repressor LexA [Treponema sp.]